MDMHQNTYFFGGTDNRVFSYIALDIENRKRSGFTWISTYPNFKYGTLESGAMSGEVSSSNVEQSLRVNRTIKALVQGPSSIVTQTIRQDIYVTMDPVGWSFKEIRTGDSDEYMLIDNVISNAFLGPNDAIIAVTGDPYGYARGKISVNWTNRSTTMDIQLGCQ